MNRDAINLRRCWMTIGAALVIAGGDAAGAASASNDQFSIRAGGSAGIAADGAINETSTERLSTSGTLLSRPRAGTAPFTFAAGPGVVRTSLSGSFSAPPLVTLAFTPQASARARTTLVVAGPPGSLTASLNVEVAGTMRHDCPGALILTCASRVFVDVRVPFATFTTELRTSSGAFRNDLGLTVTPTSDGFAISGAVTTPPFPVTANQPFDVEVAVRIEVGVGSKGVAATSTWEYDFATGGRGVSFPARGPVLNVPAGYEVDGSSVSGNRWRDPFAPAPVDVVAPVVTGVPDRAPNERGWYRAPVVIDWQAVDPEPSSGAPTDPPDTFAAEEGRVDYLSGSACDPAENCAEGTLTLSIDMTPPTVTCPTPAPVFAASQNLIPLIRVTVTDSQSGPEGEETRLVNTDPFTVGAKTSVVTARDLAGNETQQTCEYRIADLVAPVVTGAPEREPNERGWYRAPVVIDWQAVDPEPSSGAPTDPPDTFAAVEGRIDYRSGLACDPAGNCTEGVLALSIDTTPPAVTCPTPVPVHALGSLALVAATVADGLSGVRASVLLRFADTSTVGAKTAVFTASDLAGNEIEQACAYRVEFVFGGFESPVDDPPELNAVNAGQTVALKWRLTDASGAPVTELGAATLTAATLACDLGRTVDLPQEAIAGESGLQNLGDGYYQLNWRTPRSYAGSCKTLRLDLGEGEPRTASFAFRR